MIKNKEKKIKLEVKLSQIRKILGGDYKINLIVNKKRFDITSIKRLDFDDEDDDFDDEDDFPIRPFPKPKITYIY